MDWRNGLKNLVLLIAIFFIASCTKKNESGSVKLTLPKTGSFKSASLSASSATDEWNSTVPSDINDIDCYAVFVGGPDPKLQTGSCSAADGTKLMRFGPHMGFVPAGGTIELADIPSGPDRVVFIAGVKLVDGTCENKMPASHEFTFNNYSAPYMLGRVSTSVEAGAVKPVTVVIEGIFNASTQIDDCDFFDRSITAPSPTPAPKVSIANMTTGMKHTCVVTSDGRVKCWGFGATGALGYLITSNLGNLATHMGNSLQYVDLGTGFYAVEIAAGANFTCARSNSGQVKCWGYNLSGQLGIGSTIGAGISIGSMGNSLLPVPLGTGLTATKIVAGAGHVCALLSDSSVKCWGDNTYGQLGQGDLIIRGDNAGELGDILPAINFGGTPVVDIDAGYYHNCAILNTGVVKCWGEGLNGRLGNGGGSMQSSPVSTGIANALKISLGHSHSCAIESTGALKCWGLNTDGQLGDGTVTNRTTPYLIDAGTTYSSVAPGGLHTCAMTTSSVLKCWGKNTAGQNAQEHAGSSSSPTVVSLLPLVSGITDLSSSVDTTNDYTCAKYVDGQMKCWGSNNQGQLGLGIGAASVGTAPGDISGLPYVDLGNQ